MSNVLQFPPRGEKVREVAGWLLRVQIGKSRKTHSARVVRAVYRSQAHGDVSGHTTRTDCGLLLGFIPEDKTLLDDVAANVRQTQYREDHRGEDCQRCWRVIRSEVMKMSQRERASRQRGGSEGSAA